VIPARLARLLACTDDDAELIRLCRAEMEASRDYHDKVRDILEAAAGRLREEGVPMTKIARYAGVSDTYLSRRLTGARGMARKVIRFSSRHL
jgi:AraC-like DNA-binding protein